MKLYRDSFDLVYRSMEKTVLEHMQKPNDSIHSIMNISYKFRYYNPNYYTSNDTKPFISKEKIKDFDYTNCIDEEYIYLDTIDSLTL